MTRAWIAAAALALRAGSAAAQEPAAVRPGMREAEVTARWGEPIVARTAGSWRYLYYRNGQLRDPRTYDVVFLQDGQVVDAIVRAPGRSYLGTSSSPVNRLPEFTPPRRTAPGAAGAVTGVRVTSPDTTYR
jgi:hypothetical protein